MKIENIKRVISLIDKRIIKQLGKEEINEDEIEILTTLKLNYTKELNNQIRVENTSKMFNNDKYQR